MENNATPLEVARGESTLARLLTGHPFFRAFKPEHLKVLENCSTITEFKPGEYIYRERTPANGLHLITEGRVAIELLVPGHDPWIIMTICAGGVLGWSWAFPPSLWYFSCRTMELTRTVFLEADCLRAKMKEDYELGYALMMSCGHVLEERLRATRLQLMDLLIKS
jgi:CRP/FNR family transcriptional regulator, cyclic AMP receptor protein